jgi:hypothetical protein
MALTGLEAENAKLRAALKRANADKRRLRAALKDAKAAPSWWECGRILTAALAPARPKRKGGKRGA